MTQADLECLKSHIDRQVEIDTRSGEHLRIRVISVFDGESDPDVFFDVVAVGSELAGGSGSGQSLPLNEILTVRPARS
jgi:hypothetical protein